MWHLRLEPTRFNLLLSLGYLMVVVICSVHRFVVRGRR